MRVSVDRLRWGLAAAVVLLLAGLAVLVGYGRYAAARKWAEILRKNGISVTHDTDNVTWSQTVKGRTVYTIRAKKAVQVGDGKYTLHGVTLLFYGKSANTVDRVQGDQFQYDQKAGIAKADGEVHIDIQAPGALTYAKPNSAPHAGSAPAQPDLDRDQSVIHVLTSGLVYVQKLGVAATNQHVEFHYGGITCVSTGAEFDTNGNALHLLAAVEMSGQFHGALAVVHAANADLDREQNTITIAKPRVESRGEAAEAANALLLLKPDGSVQHASAWGAVVLASPVRRVAAQRLEASFAAKNQPENAVLSGGVTLDGSPARPMHGSASETDIAFTPAAVVSGVTAKGAVRLLSSVQRLNSSGSAASAGAPPLMRELRGDQVIARFRTASGGKEAVLQQVHVVGNALARGESFTVARSKSKTEAGDPGSAVTSGITSTQVSADDLLADFTAPGREPSLQHIAGKGHTQLQQTGLRGAEEISNADTLEAFFVSGSAGNRQAGSTRGGFARAGGDAGGIRLQTAVQTGYVQIRDQAAPQGNKRGTIATAHGDRAAFDGVADKLTLTGAAAYQQEGTSLQADAVSVVQSSGSAEAVGRVEASLTSQGGETTHVFADRAHLLRGPQTAEFFGTDAHPARLWQGGSQVMAANLFVDDAHQSLAAKPATKAGIVEAIFAAEKSTANPSIPAAATATPVGQRRKQDGSDLNVGAGSAAASSDVVHVGAPSLNYSGSRHEAVCTGGVRVRQGVTQIHSEQAVVFLTGLPASASSGMKPVAGADAGANGDDRVASVGELGGSVARMVFTGDVRLDAPGRAGDGSRLVYAAKDGSYLLTGSPGKMPRVADAVQGMVTGTELLFRSAERSVIVNGTSASNNHGTGRDAGARVHTELNVRPQDR